jgi:hypothetical protein
VVTEILAFVDNWRFVRDRRTSKRFEPCEKHHCTVSLKFSSTHFKKPNSPKTGTAADSLYLDRNGLILPYDSFLSLIRDEEFTDAYMSAARTKYEADTKTKLVPSGRKSPAAAAVNNNDDNGNVDDGDNDDEEILVIRKNRKKPSNKRPLDDDDDDDDDDGADNAVASGAASQVVESEPPKKPPTRRAVVIAERTPPPSPTPSLEKLLDEDDTPLECI